MLHYYEVLIADSRYHSDTPLTYSSETELQTGQVVSLPLRGRTVTGFVYRQVAKPKFATKAIKSRLSDSCLPAHALPLAQWLNKYYAASLGACLRQLAPSKPIVRRRDLAPSAPADDLAKSLEKPLTNDQKQALRDIKASSSTTLLLHGETGSGKTRVYLELARQTIKAERSVLILTPEIGLTGQLVQVVKQFLQRPVLVLHSDLPAAERKRLWLAILEAKEPVVIIGPRSALFSPVQNLGLIVVDEAHEPAYKQDQTPRYHAPRVASQLGKLTKAKVILGSATPSLVDYHLAKEHGAIIRMSQLAVKSDLPKPKIAVVDLKNKANLSANPYLSKVLIDSIKDSLSSSQQVLVYLNRRGSARVILCRLCGWQMTCPNCDLPLTYHADQHLARCHTCGYQTAPPLACPQCQNPDIVYKSAGTKALADELSRLFPNARVQRFDSDNQPAERLHQLYPKLRDGQIDILVGTQLLVKGFDLPKLGLVGVIAAESSLAMPDFSAEERTFQLLYQVIGRVGRGHQAGRVVVQSYEPGSDIIQAAIKRDYSAFSELALKERRQFGFPPYRYLMLLRVHRKSAASAQKAAEQLRQKLLAANAKVEIIGPSPCFYGRRGSDFFWQLVVKAVQRQQLVELAQKVPADWQIDIDPTDLL